MRWSQIDQPALFEVCSPQSQRIRYYRHAAAIAAMPTLASARAGGSTPSDPTNEAPAKESLDFFEPYLRENPIKSDSATPSDEETQE